MKIEELKAYEILEKREIEDLHSVGYRLKHKETGALFAVLENDDENKVFTVGFRTPPEDSTGVAHILEHSVLCGSEKFPAKDPFVELAKGSLNTFLNAMTYPDKTLYPVASCNDKDFQNLMHVYLDAVFFPNIKNEKNIFLQEGWHYKLENKEDELEITGVVYNEMKGAFSSPDDVLWREITTSLFPDTTYSVESGGDPKFIPDLSYENFLAFHDRYYHPSNSYFYLYGNMDISEKLEFIHKEYLSKFKKIDINSEVGYQQPFENMVERTTSYPITEEEQEEENTYLSYNMVVGDSLNKDLYLALQILDYALCTAPGAPIKQALIDAGIGKDVFSICESSIRQPLFGIISKNADSEQKEEFIRIIECVLREQRDKGIDKKALRAGLNYFEFRYREADYGSYPKGLMYGLKMFDSWLYDEEKPFIHVEANETFARLKDKIDTGYYEQLIEAYMLNNTHKSIVIVLPEKGLTSKNDKLLMEKLADYKKTLSEDEISEIVRMTKDLEVYQEEPSSKEALESIPLLKREDMKKEAAPFINELIRKEDTDILFHDVFSNGIIYMKQLFDLSKVPQDLVPYLGILKNVIGYVDTQHYTYGDLFNEINILTGGITAGINTYTSAEDRLKYKYLFEIRAKALYPNRKEAFRLIEEMILASNYRDGKRLYEIIAETKSKMQGDFMSAGHSLAAVRALSYVSPTAELSEQTSGLTFFRLLEDLEENFEEKKTGLMEKLEELSRIIFRPENLMLDVTCDQEGMNDFSEELKNYKKHLYTSQERTGISQPICNLKNEGFTNSSQIQYVCRAGNYTTKGLDYKGSLRVLKVIMGYDYLWNNVRVKGGAYGCMCNFGRNGDSYFVSYRDPNLDKTLETYKKASNYIAGFEADERTMTKYIIGAISDLDVPMNPASKGARSLAAYLSGLSFEAVQKERDELLKTDVLQIRELSKYIDGFMEDECLCVVGNQDKIQKNKELFKRLENLFH